MKKSFIILLCLILITTMVACQTNDETPAETENSETPDIASEALEEIPKRIVEANFLQK